MPFYSLRRKKTPPAPLNSSTLDGVTSVGTLDLSNSPVTISTFDDMFSAPGLYIIIKYDSLINDSQSYNVRVLKSSNRVEPYETSTVYYASSVTKRVVMVSGVPTNTISAQIALI
jgi:hypothetical protein